MSKLSDMSNEELWQLFPIIISPPKDEWKLWYEEEAKKIEDILGNRYQHKLNHVGSTSIKGIYSKPTVDMLLEVEDGCLMSAAKLIAENGWIIMAENDDWIVLNKGYLECGYAERVFHLHIKRFGDDKEVVFRDYMNGHPDDAKAYEKLKLSLLPDYKNNRDGYTAAKTEFCDEIYLKAYKLLGKTYFK